MKKLKAFLIAAVAVGTIAFTPENLSAQSQFSPVATVNEMVVTRYELEQRAQFYKVIRRLGNLEKIALDDLIEDRLKMLAARELGIEINDEQLKAGMDEFAGRANLSSEDFIAAITREGIEVQTFRDFVRVGLMWRGVVQARFRGRVQISDAEIDAALGSSGQAGLRVLLSEIILPLTPENEAQARDLAAQISSLTSSREFADAARRFSAAGSRNNDGRLDWLPLTRLPAPLQPVILELKPGEVSAPIELEGAIAIFQMRGVEEMPVQKSAVAAIEYGVLRLPGGRSAETLARAEDIRGSIDTCDDLYGVNFGGPDEALTIQSQQPAEIPRDIALELAKLDRHEVSTALTSQDGSQLLFVMLCGRTASVNEEASREDVLSALRNRRLSSYADGYLEQLRADAKIEIK
ncbi:peptidylprolyl isomerase [Cognatishimia maritima]|uniref:Parvulin-like PPIase n=1 Tax=Cognatishimia maritima TaxID=870908 RepID=A0A1M5ITX8_9RHOB|nr:peptidylprolyl isomerase [Cognatishimia maritima]SHG31625.1 periplasmic chaperone for outer membrane proteins SurA [Cognatishimia maritima]